MTIPSRIKIGGHEVTVSIEDLSKENISGDWNPAKNLIRIASEEAASQQEATLLHEMMHAMNSQLGDDGFAHALLESLSQQLYACLKENHMLR